MIRRHFRNALHWYQVLIVIADQEVDIWIRNARPAVTASPGNTNNAESTQAGISIQESLPNLQQVPVVESSRPTSTPLGGTATPFFQSDMLNALPVPFPLLKDFLWMEENTPSAGEPSMYLQ
jgi:hypothetical protein